MFYDALMDLGNPLWDIFSILDLFLGGRHQKNLNLDYLPRAILRTS